MSPFIDVLFLPFAVLLLRFSSLHPLPLQFSPNSDSRSQYPLQLAFLNLFLCAVVKVRLADRLPFPFALFERSVLQALSGSPFAPSRKLRQWVAVDSNYRPLAYQASALTD